MFRHTQTPLSMSDVDVAMGLLTLVPFCSRKNSWLFMVGVNHQTRYIPHKPPLMMYTDIYS